MPQPPDQANIPDAVPPDEQSADAPRIAAALPYDDDEKQEIEVLSHLENSRLISQYAAAVHTQDEELINRIKWKIVLANIPLIYTISWPLFKRLRCADKGFEIEDLVSVGYEGVLRAIVTFDPSRNLTFATYAGWWIKSFVVRYIHDHDRTMRIPQYIHEKIPKIRMAEDFFLMQGRADCSDQEIADRLGWQEREVAEIRSVIRRSFTSLDEPRGHDHDADMYKYCPDKTPDPENTLMTESWHEVIRSLLNLSPNVKWGLKTGERCILKLRFGLAGGESEKIIVKVQDDKQGKVFREIPVHYDGHEKTLEEIGELFGVTRERIRQLELSALRKLRRLYYTQIIKETDPANMSLEELALLQQLRDRDPGDTKFRRHARPSRKKSRMHDSENFQILKRFVLDKDIQIG